MKPDFTATRKRLPAGRYALCQRCTQTIPDLPEDADIDPEIRTYCSVECMPASTMPAPRVRQS